MKKRAKITTTLLAACAAVLLSTAPADAATGWSFTDGSWYYFDKNTGIMQTGNVTDNGRLYYLRDDGRMVTGTIQHSDGNYTYDASGALNVPKEGWYKVNGYYYYFINSNTVLTSSVTPDGYFVNNHGQWSDAFINKGIDVSRYQNTINWPLVAADGIGFAMVRIGSVKYGVDAQFAANMLGARDAGLRVGAYVYSYATTVEQAIAEANFAIEQLKPYAVSFPVAIDIESTSQKAKSPAELAAIANAFCATVKAAGYYPIVYSSKSWFTQRIDTAAIPYDLWVAQYNSVCTYDRYDMWQASSKGRVNGIAGNVDINYLYKDYYSLIPRTGWSYINNKWYYLNADGSMATGWLKYRDTWYYLEPSTGIMAEGWIKLGNDWYYLTPVSGAMLQSCTQTIDGVSYRFNSSGVWIP